MDGAELQLAFPHLLADVLPMMLKTDEQRMDYVNGDFYVEPEQLRVLADEVQALIRMPDSRRPLGILLIAESQMGKTTLLEQIEFLHPASDNPEGDYASVPVLRVQFPETGGAHIWGEITSKLNVALPATASMPRHRREALEHMESVGMKLLIVDELANTLDTSKSKQHVALNAIKFIMNDFKRPVVMGITPQVWDEIKKDPQIQNRFEARVLMRYSGDALKDFLEGWEKVLPLRKASSLGAPGLCEKIEEITQGLTGSIEMLLKKATKLAIGGGEQITAELLEEIGFVTVAHVDEAVRLMRNPRKPT